MGINLNYIRCEANRHFRNKKDISNKKINELAMKSENKNIRDLYRGINEFKRCYQLRNNLVNGENGDLLANSLKILNSWKHYFSVIDCNISDVRQIEIHTTEPLVPDLGPFEVKIANLTLKKA
jgi:hypothetical protein